MVCPERKSVEPIALLVGHGDVSGLQKFAASMGPSRTRPRKGGPSSSPRRAESSASYSPEGPSRRSAARQASRPCQALTAWGWRSPDAHVGRPRRVVRAARGRVEVQPRFSSGSRSHV
jgi:hypothetical protein